MKQFKTLLIIVVLAFTAACSKGGDTPTPVPPVVTPVAEPDITFNLEIAGAVIDYNTYFAALGATQAINVNVTSTFPKDGVTIQVVVNNETGFLRKFPRGFYINMIILQMPVFSF